MLQITNNQLALIGQAHFLNRAREMLLNQYPDDAEALSHPEFESTVMHLVERAQSYGLGDEQSVAIFIATAWLLGTDFDANFTELRDILVRTDLVPKQKVAALEAFALKLLEELGSMGQGV